MPPRRTVLAVPGSSQRFIEKSRTQPVDAVFLDLEDAVAPSAKPEARNTIISALQAGSWDAGLVTLRVNDWTTPWTCEDITTVVGQAGKYIDAVVLPKVQSADHITALDLVLTQVEKRAGLPIGEIGIEAQIEDAAGLIEVNQIASCSQRLQSLVFGPGDFMASLGMGSLTVGANLPGYESDHFHQVLMSILVAARANGLQAIDGPFVGIRDLDGFAVSAAKAAALGYDGKWVLHPNQVELGNKIFTPPAADIERARKIVAAYQAATSEAKAVGAIVVDEEMVDEAGVRLARMVLSKTGRLEE
ncbi:MAG: CoA ester lyase [Actinomycetales bacterium]|nr:MAG: CoA ester lyase [Actinomycetales bacterium]